MRPNLCIQGTQLGPRACFPLPLDFLSRLFTTSSPHPAESQKREQKQLEKKNKETWELTIKLH